MVVIFNYFMVPPTAKHRVLFYGILGALVMRGLFIWLGTMLLSRFEWILYVFGAMLLFTGIRMLFKHDEEFEGEQNRVVKLVRRFIPLTHDYDGTRFFTQVDSRRVATPLLLVLILVEFTDLIFAVDSIPAIFGITRDPFIIYTSNVFAILGLRAMYFLLAALLPRFRYLKHGLSAVLVFIGARMLSDDVLHVPTAAALLAVVAILAIAVAASMLAGAGKGSGEDAP